MNLPKHLRESGVIQAGTIRACFSSLGKVLKFINSRYIFIGFKRLDICIVYYFILLYTITCVPWAEEVTFAIVWSRPSCHISTYILIYLL